ncbi:coniferyl-alcohol dehydrogenase [Gordonia sp. SL306]|uniref:coniferyl-alcohol dehydrogenase n=1 Tax=Gordonia sp. SL306 TaxID=2995145 RepID=UPI002270050D|nr:coniferyl-alcohol dehydrogenase [Gordonia sp. SL306]WAC57091.1 coniferyl-alcohol dehydrogenase [Gordonia sp. SL306]
MGSEQRKIVVVGAGSGIGAATAAHFHGRGDHVLAVDIKPNDTPAAEHREVDLRDGAAVTALLGSMGSGWDLLAHVAGVPGTAPDSDVLRINYLGARRMIEGMLPLLNPGGAIVAVASTAGMGWTQRTELLEGLLEADDADGVDGWLAAQEPGYPAYNTSKEALLIYAKRVSGPALAEYGVRVNTVSPGPVETPILTDFEESMGKDTLEMVRATVGRHGNVDDIVPAIDFLGSPDARWVNGQNLEVDGGFIASMIAGAPIQL